MAETASRVRWDRIGRLALVLVGALVLGLYVNPLRAFVAAQQEAKAKRAEVAGLQREHSSLVRRQRALRRPGSIEIEARRLGMVRRGERAYVVRGLPRD